MHTRCRVHRLPAGLLEIPLPMVMTNGVPVDDMLSPMDMMETPSAVTVLATAGMVISTSGPVSM